MFPFGNLSSDAVHRAGDAPDREHGAAQGQARARSARELTGSLPGALAVVPLRLSQRCARELCDFAVDPPTVASAEVRGRHVAENIKRAQLVQVVVDDGCAIVALPAKCVSAAAIVSSGSSLSGDVAA
jgi:hypothetical protein